MSTTNLVLHSTVKPNPQDSKSGFVEATLLSQPLPSLKDNEVLIRVEAASINPSDLMLLFSFGDTSSVSTSKDPKTGYPVARANVPPQVYSSLKERINVPLPVGNEGAGEVVQAGKSVQHLLGKKVATFGGSMYATYRIAPATSVIELLPGTTSRDAAAAFVNPLTVLGFLYTLKEGKFKGLIHTAAASQLGQQLVKACKADNIPLINIVRKQEQVEILKNLGAKYILNSSEPDFLKKLEEAIVETEAYLAFDATGGGKLTGQILTAMEKAAARGKTYSRYGTDTVKRVYIYGALDTTPLTLSPLAAGFKWDIGGWLVTQEFIGKIGPTGLQKCFQRIAKEIKTTFSTSFDQEISLIEALGNKEAIQNYARMATGAKFVINPSKGISSKL